MKYVVVHVTVGFVFFAVAVFVVVVVVFMICSVNLH